MNYGTSTRYGPQEVLRAAERFFGPEGAGLALVERRADRLELAGEAGRISLRVQVTNGVTEAFLSTQGLDEQVSRFLVDICEETRLCE